MEWWRVVMVKISPHCSWPPKVRQMWRCGDADERRDVEAHTRTALRPETTAATMSGNKGSRF